jgi:ankyrin repeat protein
MHNKLKYLNQVHVKDKYGNTPLHDACSNGHTDMAKWLVSNGADINAKNDSGSTPLHLANNKLKKELEKCIIN